jgi:hypothetical protein
MVLRRVFMSKMDKVIGGLRKLHNGRPCNSYPWPSAIRMRRMMRWIGHVAYMGEK